MGSLRVRMSINQRAGSHNQLFVIPLCHFSILTSVNCLYNARQDQHGKSSSECSAL